MQAAQIERSWNAVSSSSDEQNTQRSIGRVNTTE
ncbi:MAG: hypothetical protein QOG02_1036, partial [Gaiellales bacterium]|nr:hypothetical protein [Gaiellales bacterium]